MGDTTPREPDFTCLFQTASEQHGYFTTAQARICGFSWNMLTYHGRQSGRFIRVRRALYRMRDYPPFPREDVVSAWLAVGKDKAVVSHESALELLEISDIIPEFVHLTVSRATRNLPKPPNVKIHTTMFPLTIGDITVRDGIRVTSVARSIVEAADTGAAPEQIEMAIRQAIERRLSTRNRIELAADKKSTRVQKLVRDTLRTI